MRDVIHSKMHNFSCLPSTPPSDRQQEIHRRQQLIPETHTETFEIQTSSGVVKLYDGYSLKSKPEERSVVCI